MPPDSAAEAEPVLRVGRGFSAIARASDGKWRGRLRPDLISFTEPGWDPLTQVFGSFAGGLIATGIREHEAADCGLVPQGAQDAARLRTHWRLYLHNILAELRSRPPPLTGSPINSRIAAALLARGALTAMAAPAVAAVTATAPVPLQRCTTWRARDVLRLTHAQGAGLPSRCSRSPRSWTAPASRPLAVAGNGTCGLRTGAVRPTERTRCTGLLQREEAGPRC